MRFYVCPLKKETPVFGILFIWLSRFWRDNHLLTRAFAADERGFFFDHPRKSVKFGNCSGILFYAVFGRTEVLPQFVKVR
jgi:hypothetical protein